MSGVSDKWRLFLSANNIASSSDPEIDRTIKNLHESPAPALHDTDYYARICDICDGKFSWTNKPCDKPCDLEDGEVVDDEESVVKTVNIRGGVTGLRVDIRTFMVDIKVFPRLNSDGRNTSHHLIKLTLADRVGTTLICTPRQAIWTGTARRWRRADVLNAGDEVFYDSSFMRNNATPNDTVIKIAHAEQCAVFMPMYKVSVTNGGAFCVGTDSKPHTYVSEHFLLFDGHNDDTDEW